MCFFIAAQVDLRSRVGLILRFYVSSHIRAQIDFSSPVAGNQGEIECTQGRRAKGKGGRLQTRNSGLHEAADERLMTGHNWQNWHN